MTAKKEAVQAYIDRVLAPKIQGDGGWVEFVSLEGDRLTLRFRGECSKCLRIVKEVQVWHILKWNGALCARRNGRTCAFVG